MLKSFKSSNHHFIKLLPGLKVNINYLYDKYFLAGLKFNYKFL